MALYVMSQVSCTQRRKIQMYMTRVDNLSDSSNKRKLFEYKKCCRILEVSESCDQEQIRQAYLQLAKRYHPDNPDHGNLEKFQEVDHAFRTLIQKKARERWDVEDAYELDEKHEFDIKHTAPQHRQYLSNEGVGSGTPFQREKQYVKMRVMQAADNVLQHRIAKVTADEKSLIEKKVPLNHKIKTKYGIDRLVEDLIQESMSKGEFSNLAGSGKPLKTHADANPYVDFTTHKINQVLIDNGFTPAWITLQKEIREDIDKLRCNLAMERRNFGTYPLNETDAYDWEMATKKFDNETAQINKKIDKFNLVVPILNKQMLQVSLQRETERILANGVPGPEEGRKKATELHAREREANNQDRSKHIFSLLDFFKF